MSETQNKSISKIFNSIIWNFTERSPEWYKQTHLNKILKLHIVEHAMKSESKKN